MESNKEIIEDLKSLLEIVNDGKEGYKSSAEATDSIELKALFGKFMGERIVYADELKAHIATHGGEADNENGGLLGGIHRTWINIKQALTSKDDKAILNAIATGERAAIEKYDQYIADYVDHADHITLLTAHRDGIKDALAEIEKLVVQYN